MEQNPIARQNDLVVQETGGEMLVYDLKTNKAICLNATSANVWNLCNGKRSVSSITSGLSSMTATRVEPELVYLALDLLRKENLLDGDFRAPASFSGLSRRDVIRKIGFTSLIALPMISSLVAPKAAFAQSGLPLLAQCGPGFGTCGSGASCVNTFTLSLSPGATPTGISQCCTPGSPLTDINGVYCSNTPCTNIITCDGSAAIAAPPNQTCLNQLLNTCQTTYFGQSLKLFVF
ncbi:MAG: PqqD family protein [Acidobacteria bacterium]|nr:PqqD family protein [Acidobacteriota bacterium]